MTHLAHDLHANWHLAIRECCWHRDGGQPSKTRPNSEHIRCHLLQHLRERERETCVCVCVCASSVADKSSKQEHKNKNHNNSRAGHQLTSAPGPRAVETNGASEAATGRSSASTPLRRHASREERGGEGAKAQLGSREHKWGRGKKKKKKKKNHADHTS